MITIPLSLQHWAQRWGIGPACLADLLQCFGLTPQAPRNSQTDRTKEGYWQSLVRLDGARNGVNLYRNNVGVLRDKNDRPVRFGLANDSKEVNENFKSGDLLGWRPVTITHAHIGTTIAQFVSRECKKDGWKYTGDEHETAQMNWAMLVNKDGGDAKFATGEGSFK